MNSSENEFHKVEFTGQWKHTFKYGLIGFDKIKVNCINH